MPERGLGWRPGRVSLVTLALAALVGAWLLSPPWWTRLGNDSQVFYAAATLAADGGNPYDLPSLTAAEKDVYQEVPPGARGAFSPAPYAYPPLATGLWELLLPLGRVGFFWANAAVMLAAGLGGSLLVLAALRFRERLVPVAAATVSAAMVLGLVAGNPSNLVFLAWAGALYLVTRGRPALGGAVLALTLVKAPVGLAMALALLVGFPGAAAAVLIGFGAGLALFLAANLMALGPLAMQAWLAGLLPYSSGLGAAADHGYSQCCLAGLPGLLVDHEPLLVATLLPAAAAAVAVALRASDRGWRRAVLADPIGRLAVAVAVVLAVSPYLHLNDLLLLEVPLLFLASRRPRAASVAVLLTWGLGAIAPLAVSLGLGLARHQQAVSGAGFGIVLTSGALAALLLVHPGRRQPRAESSPEASQRR